jgi:hypothetical protein
MASRALLHSREKVAIVDFNASSGGNLQQLIS